jgi:Domain of unknown function (DUF1772)
MTLRLICNALGISGSAMFAGVMLAIGVTLGGYWKNLPPEGFLVWFGQNIHFITRSISLVVPATLVGMAGSLWLSWADRRARNLWLAGSGCIVAVLLITAAYYLPSNARFAGRSIPLEQVPAALDTWLLVHNVRISLAVLASVLGVVAISRERAGAGPEDPVGVSTARQSGSRP